MPSAYPLDLTATALSNRIVAQPYEVDATHPRLFAPSNGPFYTQGLVLRNASNNQILQPVIDYVAVHLHEEATVRSGKEVCCFLYIKNPAISSVLITRQVVGGEYEDLYGELLQFLNDNQGINPQDIYWSRILDKPASFPPSAHTHLPNDWHGYTQMIALLDRIKNLLQVGEASSLSAVYQYLDSRLETAGRIKPGGILLTLKRYANSEEVTAGEGYGTWARIPGGHTLVSQIPSNEPNNSRPGEFFDIGDVFGHYDAMELPNDLQSGSPPKTTLYTVATKTVGMWYRTDGLGSTVIIPPPATATYINFTTDSSTPLNLAAEFLRLEGRPITENDIVVFEIETGCKFTSNNTSSAAISTGTWPVGASVELIVNGEVFGRGGKGGNVIGGGTFSELLAGLDGANGGDAIAITSALNVTVNSGGKVYGGGGGGGAMYCISGGNHYGGAGGGGQPYGLGGTVDAPTSIAGTNATWTAYGNGGLSGNPPDILTTGAHGGAIGVDGFGDVAVDPSETTHSHYPGSGGLAGKAFVGDTGLLSLTVNPGGNVGPY